MFQYHQSGARLRGFGRRTTFRDRGSILPLVQMWGTEPGRGMKHTFHTVCSEQCIHVYIHEAARMDIQLQFVGYLKKGKLTITGYIHSNRTLDTLFRSDCFSFVKMIYCTIPYWDLVVF